MENIKKMISPCIKSKRCQKNQYHLPWLASEISKISTHCFLNFLKFCKKYQFLLISVNERTQKKNLEMEINVFLEKIKKTFNNVIFC